jgi:hypothetical protein|nr:MAG TPA: FIBRONECTIN, EXTRACELLULAR MATRIX, CELL ADHESION.0A [Caudoviricetes sp.]
MATVYSGQRWNGEGSCYWRIRVDYSDNSANVYVDVGPSGWSIWLRFTSGNNTFTKNATTYYASNNGKSANLLGTLSISPYSATTVYQTCSGSTWGGNVNGESSVTIPQQYSPAGPTYSRSVSGITRTSATLNVSCSSNPANYWRIHWYDTSGSWVGYSGNGATGSWTYTQDNLTPNTSYNFYTQVTNNNDGEETGLSPIEFTTTGNAPTINSVAVSPSRTSAIFNPSVSYDTNASFSSYSIRYGTSTSYGSTSTSTTISGLTPNTTYYYSMTVTDNWGRTSAAKTGSFKTTGNNPTINSHGVKTYAQTSVEMQYSASYDTNDSLSSYKWEYGTSTSYGSSVTGTNIINGLNANTTYYYKLTVTSTQGRNSTTIGSFKTDPATVTISALGISEITETTAKVDYTFNNPSNVGQFYVIETILEREDGTSQNYQANNIIPPYTKVYDNLEPGSKYTCKTRVGIKGQSGTVYYSQWASQDFETLASTPFVKIDSNGVIKHYKGYALGKSDIYNGYSSEWKNGNYSETVNSPISFNGEGAGVSKVKYIEIMPNDAYAYEFPVEQFTTSSNITLILTNVSDIVQKVVKVTPGQSGSINTDSSTRLYITCTGTDLNKETARYVRFSIYRSISKVPLDKESIVTLNNKIRYIDISQNGYIKGTTTGSDGKIIELDVYDKLGNNIALNKNVTMEKGSGSNLEKITDGNHDGSSYCTLNENSAGTTVRVDLGQEYSYDQIDRVVLWRDVDCIYQESRLLGLDASKQITWKFQSYKSEGVYKETSEGYTARPRKAKTKHNIYITSLLNESDNPPFADKITINADWNISIPPVIADLTTHRVDAIIAANSGRLLKNDVGDLTALTTTEKSNLVDAINEIWEGINKTEEEFTVLDFVLESILCG